ncbi:TatD family hydrolase [Bifidobacterium sp. SO1]|uniref:TatD family hydrolase n=1 Tax=Bifidobacterium sp. SO1 TaxID=2809029 RepID=UPI001BDBBC42|nr:TatD family hydrolase [Bifidobacterium sp. SO1]MBT1160425.1 TatD family hydrolase [Bifidobacterium sp. SO1]
MENLSPNMRHDAALMDTFASLLSDAHCHADDARFVAVQRTYGVSSVISCANGDQWRHTLSWIDGAADGDETGGGARTGPSIDSIDDRAVPEAPGAVDARPDIRVSFGIHPWDANRYRIEDALPYLEQAAIIGEIGLDGEWTDVPLADQLTAFAAQLDYASRLRKPVILHTKSREREVLELIRKYPNRYMVHWYACDRWQDEYLGMGCYMSIGPDVTADESVRSLARRIPDDRLLVESDGLESLTWALGREYGVDDYVGALIDLLRTLAAIRAGGSCGDGCDDRRDGRFGNGPTDDEPRPDGRLAHDRLETAAIGLAALTRRNLAAFCAPIPSRPL